MRMKPLGITCSRKLQMNSPASSVRTLRRCRAPILNIPRATEVSVSVVRAFVHMSEMIASSKDLSRRIKQLEAKMDAKFRVVFEAILELTTPPEPKRRAIGFARPKRSSATNTTRSARLGIGSSISAFYLWSDFSGFIADTEAKDVLLHPSRSHLSALGWPIVVRNYLARHQRRESRRSNGHLPLQIAGYRA
jgi:hypothetical protein